MSALRTILIVEDCEEDRQLYIRFLSKSPDLHFRFLEAESLTEARSLLASRDEIDCVLLDYRLPDGEGPDFLQEFPATPATPPTIMLTGEGNEAIAVAAMRAGADAYLVKGELTAVALVEEVRSALENARTRRELAASEAELARANARNQLLLETVAEGILGLDRDGTITFANPAAGISLGQEPSTMIGESVHVLLHQASDHAAAHPRTSCPLVMGFPEDHQHSVSEDLFARGDGTLLPVEYSRSPIVNGNSEVAGCVVAFRDVSEQRQLQEQLLQSQKLESVGRLASGIAHEINTPTQFVSDNVDFLRQAFSDITGVLKAYSGLLADPGREPVAGPLVERLRAEGHGEDLGYLIEEIPRALDQSLEGLRRISEIVLAMRDFAHPGSPEKATVDLNRAIQSTLTVARNEWKYLADLETDFDADLPPVLCLAGELNQAVLNIVVNAAHAIGDATDDGTRGKGRICIRTRHEDGHARIEISDTGPGIPEAVQSQIFDPFFTTKAVGRGTGQGLAIARSVVVDKHGGTLDCETTVGSGTTFVIRIPLDDANTSTPGVEE